MSDNRRHRERPEPLNKFAIFERGRGLVSLRCRVCGTEIGKPMPVGQQRVRRVGQQTVVETEVQFTYLASYRELEIERADGGRHIGNACADCAPKVAADPALLAQFCETDLAQWRAEGHKITREMDDRSIPKAVKRVADYIRD